MPNSRGFIRCYGEIKKWDFATGKWVLAGDPDDPTLRLDENGVLEGIYKANSSSCTIFDSNMEVVRYFEDLPEWDEEKWDARLAELEAAMADLDALDQPKKAFCERGVADIMNMDGLIMAINDSGAAAIVKWRYGTNNKEMETPLPDGCIAVFMGKIENHIARHFSLQ